MRDLKALFSLTAKIFATCSLILLAITATWGTKSGFVSNSQNEGKHAMAFAISSKDFQNGSEIPKKFTCDGQDVSPDLSWTDPPEGTKTFALIADDPDAPAGTWTHWVLFDVPANTKNLPEGMSKDEQLPNGARQGRNDFRKIGYNGPCPPPGKPHRYFFKLYAVDSMVNLKPGAAKQQLEHALEGHTVGKAELMGRYKR